MGKGKRIDMGSGKRNIEMKKGGGGRLERRREGGREGGREKRMMMGAHIYGEGRKKEKAI